MSLRQCAKLKFRPLRTPTTPTLNLNSMTFLSKHTFEVDDYQLEVTVVRKIRQASSDIGAAKEFNDELDIDSLKRRLSPLPFTKRVTTFEESEPTRDSEYYFDMGVLVAQDSLFQAPLVHLQGIVTSGDSNAPIEPEPGHVIYQTDLWMLFALMDWKLSPNANLDKAPDDFGADAWISVLKVSRAWKLGTFSRLAEAALPSFKFTTSQKIEYGRALPFENFLFAGYEDIISRRNTIEPDEAHKLGMESLITLMTYREELRERYQPRVLEDTYELRRKSRIALRAILGEDIKDNWQDSSDPIAMTLLAEQENVLEWLTDVYGYFIQRTDTLTRDEASMLGFDSSITIYRAREAFLKARSCNDEPSSDFGDAGFDESTVLESVIQSSLEGQIQQKAQSAGMIDRLMLAAQYGVHRWLHIAYLELIERRKPINLFEARVMGMDRLVNLYRARDRYLKALQRGTITFTKEERSSIIRSKVRELVVQT